MTQENETRLRELGWIPVSEQMPPLGVEIEVCQADDYTQAIWTQTFKSEKEIKDSRITHWGKPLRK